MKTTPAREIISPQRDTLYRFAAATQALWYEWGNAEQLFLGKRLQKTAIEKPIYVTGLARAGTTILLELIASHPTVASHRYKDFPFLPMIYTWRRYLEAFQKRQEAPQERSHGDGLYVTADSPEAFEEMLWMHFFKDCHDGGSSEILDAKTGKPAFAAFYRNHIRSLLLAEQKSRYAAKGNYNISRLAFLRKLFPDARFVIAVRHPVSHIASLMKQHKLLGKLQTDNPALLRYMQQAGHFEFGLDRRIIRLNDDSVYETVRQAWKEDREVEGWAHYWNYIYSYVADLLANDAALAASTRLVTYESLCREPEQAISGILDHCGLGIDTGLVNHWKDKFHFPSYYKAEFSPEERQSIQRITERTAGHFGYEF